MKKMRNVLMVGLLMVGNIAPPSLVLAESLQEQNEINEQENLGLQEEKLLIPAGEELPKAIFSEEIEKSSEKDAPKDGITEPAVETYANGDIEINATNFPDEEFRKFVQTTFDSNNNDFLSAAEINAIKELKLDTTKIKNVKGMEHFSSLTNLECINNSQLEKVDVSQLSALQKLKCHGNTAMTEIVFGENPALESLNLRANNAMAKVDVSRLSALKELVCYDNKELTEIIFGEKNTAVTQARIYTNPKLNKVDVSSLSALKILKCNNTGISELDVSKNSALQELRCNNTGISELDVSNNLALQILECYSTGISALDVSNNPALIEAYVSPQTRDVTTEKVGTQWTIDFNEIMTKDQMNNVVLDASSKATLDTTTGICTFSENVTTLPTELKYKYETNHAKVENMAVTLRLTDKGLPINSNNFPDENFREFVKTKFDSNKNGFLSEAEINAIKELKLDNTTIKNVKGMEHFSNLTNLECINNSQLEKVDVSQLSALQNLKCHGNTAMTEIVFGENPALESLNLRANNAMAKVDVSRLSALQNLKCYENENLIEIIFGEKNTAVTEAMIYKNPKLNKVDVSSLSALQKLECYRNENLIEIIFGEKNTAVTEAIIYTNPKLNKVDVSSLSALKILNCVTTGISKLDVSKNRNLQSLYCNNTGISALDVSKNRNLQSLCCANTGISELDVSNNPALQELRCNNTGISKLDVRKNPALEDLDCNDTGISELDVSKNDQLKIFSCNNTGISKLDVSKNRNLQALYCKNTKLTDLDLSNNPALIEVDVSPQTRDVTTEKVGTQWTIDFKKIMTKDQLNNVVLDDSSKATLDTTTGICTFDTTITQAPTTLAYTYNMKNSSFNEMDVTLTLTPKTSGGGGGNWNWSVSKVTLYPTALSLEVAETKKLDVTITPSYANDKTLEWTSSDESIATVDEEGVVTAISEGNATITVTSRSGKKTDTCEVEVKPKKKPVEPQKNSTVDYNVHVQNYGWQEPVKEGEEAGTTGKALRMEALKLKADTSELNGAIRYKAHVQNIGWQDWKKDGETAGTTGKSLRMEAVQIELTKELAATYDIYYRAHVQNIGWQDWKKNGEEAGTTGKSLRMEAVEIKLVRKEIKD